MFKYNSFVLFAILTINIYSYCCEDAQCWATMQTALAPQGSFLDVLADAVQSFAGNQEQAKGP